MATLAVYDVPDPPPCPHCGEQYPEIRMAVKSTDIWQVGETRDVLCPNCETVVLTLTKTGRTEDA